MQQALKQVFGFDDFRPGQRQAIEAVLNGCNCAAIFPTGSGKSLCYQLPALMLPHLTLVISPLLALMKDQLSFLAQKGIAAASIDSTLSREELHQVMQGVKSGEIKILMISVERFKNERFRAFLSALNISLMVVDEAHCISEWGHNFRPDYLQLPSYARQFNIAQVLLLTATATPEVIKDMQQKFHIEDKNVVLTGFYRPNLHLRVLPVNTHNKDQALQHCLAQCGAQPGIVYVTLQHTAEQVAHKLQQQGINASAYHAGMDNDKRKRIQQRFMQGDINCIVATIAFGMGIDKSNIRYVIHYDLPKSIENYSQEIGRAGRDGSPSYCVVLACADNLSVLENFVYGDTPEKSAIRQLLGLIQDEAKHNQDQWETQLVSLSNEVNVRQLPLKTLLVYLQLSDIIEPLYAYYADYKFKLTVSEAELIARFDGERKQFVEALLNTATKARTWYTIDFDALYLSYGAERSRAIAALEYFDEKQLVELQAKQMTDVYRVSNHSLSIDDLSEQLYQHFKSKENSEVARIHNLLAFFESDRCLSQKLAEHFGDHQLTEPCGHCSVCEGSIAHLPKPQPQAPISRQALAQYCDEFRQQSPVEVTPALLSKFLCGLSVPVFTKMKARKMAGFGAFEQYPYGQVLDTVETVL